MNTVEIVVYGSPKIHVIKRLGYMRENGKSSYIQLWPNTAVWFGHSCVRVKMDVEDSVDAKLLAQRVRIAVNIGMLAKLANVKILVNRIQVTSFKTLDDFLSLTPVAKWDEVQSRLSDT